MQSSRLLRVRPQFVLFHSALFHELVPTIRYLIALIAGNHNLQKVYEALFDVRVVDTDVQSYAHRTVSAVLSTAEKEKKTKYAHAAQARHASFSPFVVSVDGVMAREAQFMVQRLADRLSTRWSKPYSEVMGWLQTRLSFAILRATNRCVRGSRVKWMSGVGMAMGQVLL